MIDPKILKNFHLDCNRFNPLIITQGSGVSFRRSSISGSESWVQGLQRTARWGAASPGPRLYPLLLLLCIFIINFNILLILFQYSNSQNNIYSLLDLPNYSNSQFINPFYHLNIHWIPIPTSSLVDIFSNSQPILPTPNWSLSNSFQLHNPHLNPNSSNSNFFHIWFPFQFPTYFACSKLFLTSCKPIPIPTLLTLVDTLRTK